MAQKRPQLQWSLNNIVRDKQGCVCNLTAQGTRLPNAATVASGTQGFCLEAREGRTSGNERSFVLRCALDSPGNCAIRSGQTDQVWTPGFPTPAAGPRPPEPRPKETPPEIALRNRDTVRVAMAMGYYESPRRCTMEDVARALGVTKSAVYHRMSKVEREALSEWLEREGNR